MAYLIEFEGRSPKIAPDAFIAPNAVLIGDVQVAAGASIWFGAVLRADLGPIFIGAEANVQDLVVIHSETPEGTLLDERTTVGHGAVLHDCHVGVGSVIGMGAILLQRSRVGEASLVAAGSLVRERQEIPSHVLAAGVPAIIKKELSGNAREWVERSAMDYVSLRARYRAAGIGNVSLGG